MPIVITATPIRNTAGELGLIIANFGSSDIPAGTSFYTSNGASANLTSGLPAGQQRLVTFFGGGSASFTGGSVVVYGAGEGPVTVPVAAAEPVTGGPCNITDNASDDIAPAIIQADDGKYYAAWATDRDGDYAIYMANSTGLCNWGDETVVVDNLGADTYPSLVQGSNGALYLAYQSDTGGDNEIYVINSTDYGVSWSAAIDVSVNASADTLPSIIQSSGGDYIVAWGADRAEGGVWESDSPDGSAWSAPAQQVAPFSVWDPFSFPMIQDSGGNYVGGMRTTEAGLLACPPAKRDEGVSFLNGTGDFIHVAGGACAWKSYGTGSSLQDRSGLYLFAYDGINAPGIINIAASRDTTWFSVTQVTNTTDTERYPSLLQDSAGVYALAYSTDADVNNNIYVRSSTDPLLW